MKKLFIAALALATVACTKSEVLETAPQKAISFGKPFVENATKAIDPSLTVETLNEFKVYATISNRTATANIFEDLQVSSTTTTNVGEAVGGKTWGYSSDNTQYWVPGNTYNFVAIANATSVTKDQTTKMPTSINFTNVDGKSDLLYATHAEEANAESGNVAFAFNHLLSKVKFTFVNGYPANSGITVKVSNVKITNAYTSGVYTIGNPTPWGGYGAANQEILFGNIVENGNAESEVAYAIPATGQAGADNSWTTSGGASSNYERLLIPGQSEFTITFTAEAYLNGVLVASKTGATVKLAAEKALKPSYSYNFVGTVGEKLEVITFSVASTGTWTPEADEPLTIQ